MTVLDALATTNRVEERYRRYLFSTYAPKRDSLREAFAKALDGDGRRGISLTNGPFLEATAPFVTGRSVDELISEGMLSPEMRCLLESSGPGDRLPVPHRNRRADLGHRDRSLPGSAASHRGGLRRSGRGWRGAA